MRSPSPGRRAGFTLMEVILTLLIMGWMLLAMTQVLTQVRQDRDRIHNIQEKQLAGPAILELLEKDLRGLFVYDLPKELHLRIQDDVQAGIDADRIDFCTTTDNLTHPPEQDGFWPGYDFNEVGYWLRRRGDSDDFLELYRREDWLRDQNPLGGGRREGSNMLLHDRVTGFSIVVYPEDGPENEVEPVEAWGTDDEPDNVGLPASILVTLEIELSPRLVREQLNPLLAKKKMRYERIIHFPEVLRREEGEAPVPVVPTILPPSEQEQATQ